jgi:hypothetical protein
MMAERGHRKIVIWTIFIIAIFTLALILADHVGNMDEPDDDSTVPEETAESTVIFLLSENVTFRCEVADTDAERAIGLMNRVSLDFDSGMLFVFEEPRNVSFWMKNTLIPLDIIFIDANGIILNIEEAEPEPGVADNSLTRYTSDGPAKWVLEINKGLSEDEGIVPGTQTIIVFN